ncbi:hypothetical protein [Mesorhizobium sp. M1393]|uniref:hypothetical protein n=1 Tax=Mesorhizobium sp. M1393 TaxID=2957094 RepID=UPI003334C1A2
MMVSIPMSARFGDNVTERSARLAWYEGPTLIEPLETEAITLVLEHEIDVSRGDVVCAAAVQGQVDHHL